jgi:hypothetical protein
MDPEPKYLRFSKETPSTMTVSSVVNDGPDKDLIEAFSAIVGKADERNKAKFALALLATFRLSTGKTLTRKEMLGRHPSVKKEGKAISAVSGQVDWFRSFIGRMADKGYVISLGDGQYQVAEDQTNTLIQFAENACTGDGIELKRLLFPADYPETKRGDADASALGDEVNPFDPPPVSDEEGPAQEGIDVIREVANNLATVATHLENIYEGLKTLLPLAARLEALDQNMTLKLAGFDTQFQAITKLISTDNRTQLRALLERASEISSRKTSLLNQWNSETRREEKFQEDLSELLALEDASR